MAGMAVDVPTAIDFNELDAPRKKFKQPLARTRPDGAGKWGHPAYRPIRDSVYSLVDSQLFTSSTLSMMSS
jgi:hypothetical protein